MVPVAMIGPPFVWLKLRLQLSTGAPISEWHAIANGRRFPRWGGYGRAYGIGPPEGNARLPAAKAVPNYASMPCPSKRELGFSGGPSAPREERPPEPVVRRHLRTTVWYPPVSDRL